MFHYLYMSTKDRKKNAHSYKLPAGEAAPTGHEITDLRPAGQWSMLDLLPATDVAALAALFPAAPKPKRARKTTGTVPWSETKAKMQRVAAASREQGEAA